MSGEIRQESATFSAVDEDFLTLECFRDYVCHELKVLKMPDINRALEQTLRPLANQFS